MEGLFVIAKGAILVLFFCNDNNGFGCKRD